MSKRKQPASLTRRIFVRSTLLSPIYRCYSLAKLCARERSCTYACRIHCRRVPLAIQPHATPCPAPGPRRPPARQVERPSALRGDRQSAQELRAQAADGTTLYRARQDCGQRRPAPRVHTRIHAPRGHQLRPLGRHQLGHDWLGRRPADRSVPAGRSVLCRGRQSPGIRGAGQRTPRDCRVCDPAARRPGPGARRHAR